MAYAFPYVFTAINTTIPWIENKEYKDSPYRFKAVARFGKYKIPWGYAKKEVRAWYKENLFEYVDGFFKKIKFAYMTDLDPMDFKNSRPYQKMDRQIIILFGIIGMLLESIYDWVFAKKNPAQL